MYKHMIPIIATVKKWRWKICLAFLFRVSLVKLLNEKVRRDYELNEEYNVSSIGGHPGYQCK